MAGLVSARTAHIEGPFARGLSQRLACAAPLGCEGPKILHRLRSRVSCSLGYLWGTLVSPWSGDPAPEALPRAMLGTVKIRKLLLFRAPGGAELPYSQPASQGGLRERIEGPARGPCVEGAGHLSPGEVARRSAGTAQGRAAPWRLSGRVEAGGRGGLAAPGQVPCSQRRAGEGC